MFEVPASKAESSDQRFEFTIDGETHSVPLLAYVTGEQARALAEAESSVDEQVAKCLLFGAPGTPVGDAVARLHADQLDALLGAYQAASGITAGESAASTDS